MFPTFTVLPISFLRRKTGTFSLLNRGFAKWDFDYSRTKKNMTNDVEKHRFRLLKAHIDGFGISRNVIPSNSSGKLYLIWSKTDAILNFVLMGTKWQHLT